MRRFVPLALLPLVAWQGRRARGAIPRLPDAGGEPRGEAPGGEPPLRLVVAGESTAAGVGAAHHGEALAGRTGAALADESGRRVEWIARGYTGARVRRIAALLAESPPAGRFDAVLLALGANDAVAGTRPARYAERLGALVGWCGRTLGAQVVLLAGVPPLADFPALPWPLSAYLGARGARLDSVHARLARASARNLEAGALGGEPLVLADPTPEDAREGYATDGFHPGPSLYARWGATLGARLAPGLERVRESGVAPQGFPASRSTSAT